jgi:two-component system CheB/CheR fusion protein
MSTSSSGRGARSGERKVTRKRKRARPSAKAPPSASPKPRLTAKRTTTARRLADAERLRHELEVHQLELHMQNEELRRAQNEAEVSLARYTEIFEYAPIGYAVLDANHAIGEVNHAGAQLLGRTSETLVGRRFDRFVAAFSHDALYDMLLAAANDKPGATAELLLAVDTQGERFVRATARLVPRTQRMLLLTFVDITEAKDRERRLALTEAALREADRRKDDFLSVLSHELRNPLAPIRNSLFVLEHAGTDSAVAAGARDIIDRQVAHMARLVDDLLDVTRIMRGKVLLRREAVDLGALVSRTVDDLRTGFTSAGIALEVSAMPGLWINADAARIVQVLSNVLGNAEKFTARDGRVVVEATGDGHEVTVVVRDDGVGVEPSMLPHLFEPFSQAPQTVDRARGGLGLGLAMVKGLVELHDGTVSVASAGPGRGTAVTIRLPAVQRAQPAALPPHLDDAPSQKVLVVDDNVDAAESLSTVLTVLGHVLRVAYTGEQGLAVARDFHPDVVICDIGLPDMDGFQVATAFRHDPDLQSCYLVALSGYAQPRDVEHAIAAGFDRHVAKPAGVGTFAEVLAHAHAR